MPTPDSDKAQETPVSGSGQHPLSPLPPAEPLEQLVPAEPPSMVATQVTESAPATLVGSAATELPPTAAAPTLLPEEGDSKRRKVEAPDLSHEDLFGDLDETPKTQVGGEETPMLS